MIELDPVLRDWADKPGPTAFLRTLHHKLVRGGGTARPLFLDQPLTEDERRELVELFGLAAVRAHRIDLRRAEQSLRASRYSMSLQDLVEGVFGSVVTQSERKRAKDEQNRLRVQRQRTELLDIMRPVRQLAHEYRLLDELPPGSTSKVPPDSMTRAGAWSTYETAIRAAATWWPRHEAGERTTKHGLAVSALGGAKRWTDQGELAFQNLVCLPFDQAVEVPDTEIRLRGPLIWRLDDVIVDARTANPWVSIPAHAALRLGRLEGDADGILLIENQENFNQVCIHTDSPQEWLCVWIKGFASDGLVEFVREFSHLPVSAWCDLDPSGIEIVQDIMKRAECEVFPVGMTPELWEVAAKRHDEPDVREEWRKRAESLAKEGPPSLRPLAARIAVTGHRVEQEALEVYDRVMPVLADQLRDIVKICGEESFTR
ncbi:Wadjet anti-phage system protein JetD domain-containing protein [Actinokineospora enzanensis]|uniref:Wadjet anti-phage system protein JetD domain-containing protein n=1 Tax=Actinokineospora enzanensis TaxID=155975 RepID=UPI00037872F9|nr:Wadjet anti-phage system protein JetD domain-containing protein [Actinokineospora enzanensis]